MGSYLFCLVVLVLGVVFLDRGVRLTGRDESFTGTITNGIANLRRNPAIEGTANSWLGRLFGILLKLAGVILIFIALLAFIILGASRVLTR